MLKRLVRGVLLGVFSTLLVCVPIFGAPGNPASTTIGDVYVFRSLVDTGDQLWFMRYDVSYTTIPSELPEDTYLMAIYAVDGVTLLFTQPVHYYQHNIISIYLTATQALTWNGAYVVRIMGNPGVFDPLIEGVNMRSRTLGAGDYYELVDLAGIMVQQAQILQTDWGITLLNPTGTLNVTGATYFDEAVPGLRNIVPEIYQVTTSYPSVTKTDWNHTYEEELLAKRGPSLNSSFINISTWLGTTPDWIATGWAGMLAIMVGGGVFSTTKRPDWSILFAGLAIPALVYVGIVSLNLYVAILFVILIGFGIFMIMGRFA